MIYELEKKFKDMQLLIINKFEKFESSKNLNKVQDKWKRPEGGGGVTHVISDGKIFDNCAINFSSIYGKKLPESASGNSLKIDAKNGYQAMGISVISHPKNPHIPSSHMNVRFFCILDKNNQIKDWWIGGGYDLTPFMPNKNDIIDWHKGAKDLLEPYGENLYKQFSENCNNYFKIPHRNERRGVGGIFFDNLKKNSTIDADYGIIFNEDSNVDISFCFCYDRSDFEMTLDMLAQNRIDTKGLVTKSINLEDFPQAFEDLKKPSDQIKVMLEPF